MDDTHKWPWVMLAFLVGFMVGFFLNDALGHAQSYVPGQGGQFRQPNQYDTGGYTLTPHGPVYDYGVPKYQPVPQPSNNFSLLWFGAGVKAGERRAEAQRKAEVLGLIDKATRQRAEICASIEQLNQFRRAIGLELGPSCEGG